MLELFLSLLSVALFLALVFLIRKLFSLKGRLEELKFEKSSQSVRYGKMTEQFIPFAADFPLNPECFRFLGSPIDGIAFADDGIVFCEFKTGKSMLSEKQRRIKQQVNDKKVKWLEFRVG